MTVCLVEVYFDPKATFLHPTIEELLAYWFQVLALTICFSVVAVREEIFFVPVYEFQETYF